ncbi:ABC transporter ATP-binding protein [Methylophaga sp.]|uniref:ABC transporter ATP-binding protein n=1 Tax=Methylophaga sp. TaxID=2024840 RepID=UPI00271CEF35|nr:ABC transporter ATP-binding protein [Methylophaga sp.]MDO8825448.1 ABC transporter ATP-binding protein [Methylophaga sp.]
MFSSLKKLYKELSDKDKKSLMILMVIIFVSAVVQVIGIAAVFPFIAVATDPSIIETNQYLSSIQQFTGLYDTRSFLIALGILVLLSLILSNAFIAFSTWMTAKFVANMVHTITSKLLENYLSESYLFHLYRNSSQLINNLTSEVGRVVNGGIMSTLKIISKGAIVIAILIFLILVNPIVALIAFLLLGGSYAVIFLLFKKKLSTTGTDITELFAERHKYMNESLGGIKELMVLGREHHYLNHFNRVSEKIISRKVFNSSVGDIPRYIIETIAFGGILVLTIYLVATGDNSKQVMPMLALYGFAGYRLMPALQEVFKSFALLKHDSVAVDGLYDDLKKVQRRAELVTSHKITKELIPINDTLKLQTISFTYPGASKKALENINLTINAKTSIGIVGSSGSGKSTLVDLILGLLSPDEGELLIDDQKLESKDIRKWQNSIGYVPQSIFLSDATIAENIAFGLPKDEINIEDVISSAKLANIHKFITESLDLGYETVVGERGARLSGGQRQRIGIARALYHKPTILILDEATSALDGSTEEAIMQSVYKLAEDLTVIMIAHRFSTIQRCNTIFVMSKGHLVSHGNYEYLLNNCDHFKTLLNEQPSITDKQ